MNRSTKRGMELVLNNVKKRLHNSKLLLNSPYSDDAFVLYSYAYEEFGKALIIKDHIKGKKAVCLGGYSKNTLKKRLEPGNTSLLHAVTSHLG